MKKKIAIITSIALVVAILSVAIPLTVCKNKTEGFDENNVVLSFSAMSDIHQQMGKNDYAGMLVNALDYSKQLNGGEPLDLALFAGDLTEETWRQQNSNYSETYNGDVQMLRSVLNYALKLDKTAVFYCLGNHETDPSQLGSEYMSKMPELFYNMLGPEYFAFDSADSMPEIGLRHLQMKGYHFLAVQPDTYWNLHGYSDYTLQWLDSKLAQITQEQPDKYVFVTAHPPIYGTVFGSYASDWADIDIVSVLEKYPQVIYFSGHIHNVLQDEMQISQNGSFTAVDCGSVKYTDVMNDINDARTTSFDNSIGTRIEDFSQGLFVQVDKNGNVRITRCDYHKRRTIKSAWELNRPSKDKSHLKTYDNDSRIENNKAPEFNENCSVSLTKSNGGLLVSWDSATDDDIVRYYNISVYRSENSTKIKLKDYNVATFTYMYSQASEMPKSLSFEIKEELGGNLLVEVYAVDVWGKRSTPIKASIS